jgi:chitodextrinase
MPTLTYQTQADAVARTTEIASLLGCGRNPNDVTLLWFVAADGSLIIPDGDPESDALRLGDLVRSNQWTESESEPVSEAFPAWSTGIAYSVGDVVSYGTRCYACRQAHISQVDWSPSAAFTLWVVHRANEDELPWIACEPVEVGWTRTHEGTIYTCLQAHTTQPDWAPNVVQTLWQSQAPPTAEWAAGVAYTVGDIVTYQGNTYECRQSHTSIITWTPSAVPALWLLIS